MGDFKTSNGTSGKDMSGGVGPGASPLGSPTGSGGGASPGQMLAFSSQAHMIADDGAPLLPNVPKSSPAHHAASAGAAGSSSQAPPAATSSVPVPSERPKSGGKGSPGHVASVGPLVLVMPHDGSGALSPSPSTAESSHTVHGHDDVQFHMGDEHDHAHEHSVHGAGAGAGLSLAAIGGAGAAVAPGTPVGTAYVPSSTGSSPVPVLV